MLKQQEIGHKHIWKYREGTNYRVCEAPFPTIESCGKIEWKNDKGEWNLTQI